MQTGATEKKNFIELSLKYARIKTRLHNLREENRIKDNTIEILEMQNMQLLKKVVLLQEELMEQERLQYFLNKKLTK